MICCPPNHRSTIISRFIPESLQQLITDGVIDGVVCPLKSGKEADLFVVERDPYHYVAKVYKERKFRSFKNDAGYREGRAVRNTRAQRALDKNTRYGKQLAEDAWHTAEVNALLTLERAGARVPKVLAHHGRVLVMEMIADPHGNLAPQLAQFPLSQQGALEMYDAILEQVILMLCNDLVHGDLSPYNVLVRDGEPVIIDMPQVVSASVNQQAGKLLERDVYAITRHLGLIEPSIKGMAKLAWQIWVEYERGTLTTEFRPDPSREREKEVGDLDGLVDFVKTTATEADLERRAAEGDADARRLLKAADRRAAKQARKIADFKLAAEEEAREKERAKERAEKRERRGQQKVEEKTRTRAGSSGGGGGGRSRGRRRRGKADGGGQSADARQGRSGDARDGRARGEGRGPREDRPKHDRPREDRPKHDRPRDDRPKDDRAKDGNSPRDANSADGKPEDGRRRRRRRRRGSKGGSNSGDGPSSRQRERTGPR